MSTLHNKALTRRFFEEVFNGRNLNVIDELCSPKWVDHNPDPGQEPTLAGVKGMFRQYWEAFPDVRAEIRSLVAEGDRVAAHIVATGTHLGSFAGAPATGRRVTVSGVDWLRFENGQAVERWGVFDMAGFAQQIGLAPTPPADALKAMSRRYYELLDKNRGDLATIRAELLHPQFTLDFGGQRGLSLETTQMMLGMFWKAFPDLAHNVVDQICEGDTVFNRLSIEATHRGEFAGVAPTNKRLKTTAIAVQRYTDGRISHVAVEVDMFGVLMQIGAVPTPGN